MQGELDVQGVEPSERYTSADPDGGSRHAESDVAPVAATYLPTGHAVHVVEASVSEKKPLEHSTHVCGVDAPTAAEKVPRGQGAQVEDRAAAL